MAMITEPLIIALLVVAMLVGWIWRLQQLQRSAADDSWLARLRRR